MRADEIWDPIFSFLRYKFPGVEFCAVPLPMERLTLSMEILHTYPINSEKLSVPQIVLLLTLQNLILINVVNA